MEYGTPFATTPAATFCYGRFPYVKAGPMPAWQNSSLALIQPRVGSLEFHLIVERLLCNPWTLLLCKLTIGVVSAYDIYLTIKYVESLSTYELNPIGRWLMRLDAGPQCELSQTASFIAAKFCGNFIALSVIELLGTWKAYIAAAVALAIAAFQLGLLGFLLFGG